MTDIRSSVLRMRSLMEGIFTVNRADAGVLECKPMAVDIRKLINKVINEAKLQHPGQHPLEAQCHDELPEVVGIDAELVRIVLTNLVGNAIKYSPNETAIKVNASVVANQLALSVQDFGIGIPSAEQSKIAKAYFRASNTTGIKGTGLGLTIVRRAVDAHGGVMAIQSEAGKGTTVSVAVPLSPA
jgi:signal transduction histidine kinase